MKKRLLALCCALAVAGAATAKIVGATSPGGNLRLEIEVADKISYTVWSGADKVLDACTLSLTLDDRTLGEAPRLRSVKRSSADEMLERRNPTKDAVVRNCYNAVQLRFAGDYAVEFRLFDDGVAYRFVTSLPGEVEVLGEECRLGLPAGSEAWLSEVNGFRSMYEEPYTRVAMAEYTPADKMSYLPVLVGMPGGKKLLLAESDVRDYPCMFVRSDGRGGFESLFPRVPKEYCPDGDRSLKVLSEEPYIARTQGTRTFPWRLAVVAGEDADLIENELVWLLAAPAADRYRNKVQLPVGTDENGHIVTGFFAGRSHRIVACADCRLQPEWMNQLAARTCALLEENGITAYNEETHTGRVRHLYMRQGWHSGQRLLCFVVNGNGLPNEAEICAILQKEFDLTTILINRNSERTNVILGRKTRTVLGPGVIEDTLAGVPLRMGVHEFYQVNTPAAETLYTKAREYAGLKETDFLLDLYCGMGTIGLSMLPDCRRLVGVEVVPQAVDGAKQTAARLGLDADRADFRCQDAGAAAAQLAAEGARPDVIVVDPPRKGCDEAALTAIAEMAPRTVVMVSCNAATAARDTKWLTEHGYKAVEAQPVDLFPRTRHVECVVLLSKV